MTALALDPHSIDYFRLSPMLIVFGVAVVSVPAAASASPVLQAVSAPSAISAETAIVAGFFEVLILMRCPSLVAGRRGASGSSW